MNAIITGSNRGIGLAIVEKFAKEGWNIWACARKSNAEFEDGISYISQEGNVWIKPVYFEMTDDSQIKLALKKIFDEKQSIDALVNNAGSGRYELFQRIPVDKARELFNINFFAPYQIMQYVLRKMERQGRGTIINISSIAAEDANPGDSIYGATKAAINILTKDLAAEYGGKGIRINAIAPGPTDTELLRKNQIAKVEQAIFSNIAMKRLGNVDEIANVVYFLASDAASFINGEIIRVDGGRTQHQLGE